MMIILIFIILIILLGLSIVPMIKIFNRFVENKNIVKDAWSNIDVALKKRHDLIPNLVNTVKGYADHEQATLTQVIAARNMATSVSKDDIKGQIKAENILSGTLKSLFAVTEAYPNLKADVSFINLQNQLSKIEELLERSRRFYNSTVRENITYGESFPGVIFAGFFKFQHFEFYEVSEEDRENAIVDFSKKDN
ncbi:MAG TPA: LemA family protein [Edaphocola sp.]|nr:LemA family protein [Edaphocola sp.]